MTKSQAVSTLEDIERILREVGRLDLSDTSLPGRASSAAGRLDDVVRPLKKLDREAKEQRL